MTWCSTIIFITGSFLDIFHFFIPSLYFSHIPCIPVQKTLDRNECERAIIRCFKVFFSSGSCPLWFLRSAGHLQYPKNYFCPWEIAWNGIQPGSNLKWFSYSFIFVPLSPIFLSFPSKEVSMGIIRLLICFEYYFQLLGELGGFGSCQLWFLRSAGHLQCP